MLGPSLPRLPVSTTLVSPLTPLPTLLSRVYFSAFFFLLKLGPNRAGEVNQKQTYNWRTEFFPGESGNRLKLKGGLPPEGANGD